MQALVFEKNGDYDKALDMASKVAIEYPDSFAALYTRGRLLAKSRPHRRLAFETLEAAYKLNPDDVSNLQIIEGGDYCTLFTCTPYGINTHRLLVRGVRIETIKEKPVIYVSNEAFRVEPLLVTPMVAAPMLLVLLIHLLVKYRTPTENTPKKKQEEGGTKSEP